MRCWEIHKAPCDEKNCHLCDTKKVEDEIHFLLDAHAYAHIRSQFKNIFNNIDLHNLLKVKTKLNLTKASL